MFSGPVLGLRLGGLLHAIKSYISFVLYTKFSYKRFKIG